MPCRTIVFSHGNSFPASTYRSLFRLWEEAGYQVHAIDKLGHDPKYPVSAGWSMLVEQLRDFIERQVGHPSYLVGHSLGGYLSAMVASRHGHLAKGVVLMDSPILAGWRAASLSLISAVGGIDRIVPSRLSAQRCNQWPDIESVRQHFTAKSKFAAFSPSVLADYVHQGTLGDSNTTSRRLSFDRDIETAIYRCMPHHLGQEFRRHPITCPVAFIGGTASPEVRTIGMDATRRLVRDQISWVKGSHLYPMEQPQQAAREVINWLAKFDAKRQPIQA